MDVFDVDTAWTAVNVAWVTLSLFSFAFGVHGIVTRRAPQFLLRLTGPERATPPQLVARSGWRLVTFSVVALMMQAGLLLPIPKPVRLALLGTAILIILVNLVAILVFVIVDGLHVRRG